MSKIIGSPLTMRDLAFSKMDLRETKNSLSETLQDTSVKRKRGRPRKNNIASICEYENTSSSDRFTDSGSNTNIKKTYQLRNKERIKASQLDFFDKISSEHNLLENKLTN